MTASPRTALTPEPAAAQTRRTTLLGFLCDAESETAIRDGLGDRIAELDLRQGNLRQATSLLRKMPSPETLLIDLEGESDPLTALRDLAEAVEPTTRVLAVGDRTDVNFYRMLTRELGIAEYCYKPLAPEMVARLFGSADGSARLAGALQGGRIVTVTSVTGGAGATTLAVNLAWYVANELRRHTLIFDPDLYTGTAALLLGGSGQGLRTALETPDRIDALFVQRTAQPVGDRLAILAGEEGLATPAQVAEGAPEALLSALQKRYNFIIADVPSAPVPLYRTLIAEAHQRVLVLEPTLASARNALRLLGLPQGARQARRAVLVLNRAGRRGGLSRSEVEQAIDHKVDVAVPDLPRLHAQCATFGRIAAEKQGAYRRAIQSLVREVAFAELPGGTKRPSSLFARLTRRAPS